MEKLTLDWHQIRLGLVLDWLELAKIGSHWIPCRRLVHRLLIEMVLDWWELARMVKMVFFEGMENWHWIVTGLAPALDWVRLAFKADWVAWISSPRRLMINQHGALVPRFLGRKVVSDWPGIGTGFVEIGIDWKGLDPVPIPCKFKTWKFSLNSSSEKTRHRPI